MMPYCANERMFMVLESLVVKDGFYPNDMAEYQDVPEPTAAMHCQTVLMSTSWALAWPLGVALSPWLWGQHLGHPTLLARWRTRCRPTKSQIALGHVSSPFVLRDL